MKRSTKYMTGAVLGLLFIVMIVFVRFIDVAAIGPEGTSIGLAALNDSFHSLTGVNMTLYKIAEYLGYAALLLCVFFAVVGIVQLIRRRSFLKVDKTIYSLGCLYAATIALYAVFEKIVVNYRPIVMPGDEHVEASFPSSHTVLAIVVMGSAIILARCYVKSVPLRRSLQVICAVALAATVLCRAWSGVHWLTDIISGALAGSSLLFIWFALTEKTIAADGLADGMNEAHRHDR